MPRFRKEKSVDGKWSRLIHPVIDQPYRMACCDCGLVHDVEFSVVRVTERFTNGSYTSETVEDKDLQVAFRCARNNRSTSAMRRKR